MERTESEKSSTLGSISQFVPDAEYWLKIKSIDRKFIEKDPVYAQFVAKEYLHYIFDKYGVAGTKLNIGNYKVEIVERHDNDIPEENWKRVFGKEKPVTLKPRITFDGDTIKFGNGDGTLAYIITDAEHLQPYFKRFVEFQSK